MNRRDLLKAAALLPLTMHNTHVEQLLGIDGTPEDGVEMPVVFIGHGNPMHALWDNPFTRSLAAVGRTLPVVPKAVLVVSAHWLTRGTYVSVSPKPATIHDFGGFPDELFQVQYPAPGAPAYAREVRRLVPEIREDEDWGLDHGAWAVLKHMFPAADIPVFQLSIDYHRPMQYHFDLAQRLRALRRRGVLVLGSGNIVHNLRMWAAKGDEQPYDWAMEFDEWSKERIANRDFASLVRYEQQGTAARLSVPTVDHYVPLLYTLALAGERDEIAFTYEEVTSAISMRCLRIG